ncbi:MAG: hypothetical protein LH478_13695 [Chitinophagaceae bacterium]|nr:hypothetical protein [Chitinophagaceae bacterium]
MADLFNKDFQEFIESLNKAAVEYLLIGGYAVILHGYIRSTADMDIWVKKTEENYQRLKVAYHLFGVPVFTQEEFFDDRIDVWGIGIEPNKIEVLNTIKGVEFDEAYAACKNFIQNNVEIKYIHLKHLLLAKEAAGRFKDKADIEQLTNRKDVSE